MNLFFYLQTFILNFSFIVILSDHIFLYFFFIKTQPFVKRKTCENGKKNTGTIAFRFRQVLLYLVYAIWTYGIELWSCACKSTIAFRQRCQSKILLTPLCTSPILRSTPTWVFQLYRTSSTPEVSSTAQS